MDVLETHKCICTAVMLLLHVLAVCLCLTSIIKTPEMVVYTVIALRECLREKQTHGGYYNLGRGNICFSHGPFWDSCIFFFLCMSHIFIDVLIYPDFSVQCHPVIHTRIVCEMTASALCLTEWCYVLCTISRHFIIHW